MVVTIQNALLVDVHVAVVRYSPLAIEFVISPGRVPVPCGRIAGRHDVPPDKALEIAGLDDETMFQAGFEGWGDDVIRVVLVEGQDKDGLFARLTLLSRAPSSP